MTTWPAWVLMVLQAVGIGAVLLGLALAYLAVQEARYDRQETREPGATVANWATEDIDLLRRSVVVLGNTALDYLRRFAQAEQDFEDTRMALGARKDELRAAEAALADIAKGIGRYSRDPLTHASNTIEDMQAIARAALAPAPPGEDP